MKNQKNYKAFTLLELIISIVVLGIVATAFPLILQTLTQTSQSVNKEEVVFNELSLMKMVLPYYFDENSTKDDNYYKDLNITNGDSELLINYSSQNTGDAREGKAQFNNNDYRSGSSDRASNIGVDAGEVEGNSSTYDDIDDFNNYSEVVHGVNLTINIAYIDDSANYSDENISFTYNNTPVNHHTNIKLIKITSDNNISIYYPTCNIGASKFLSLDEVSR